MAMLEEILALAGLRLVAVDAAGVPVAPMREDAARDRAGRRYPAHVDLRAEGWWVPAGSGMTASAPAARRDSARRQIPQVRYDRGVWKRVLRRVQGVPQDHPTRGELAARVQARVQVNVVSSRATASLR
jgi:HTH-type transcriptional regulator/antitoxin HipB